MEIIWKGNSYTNKSNRFQNIPSVIVNHVSAGSLSSMDNWFQTPTNNVSSAHFGVGRAGQIHQYVAIEDAAWTQGLKAEDIPFATAPIVKRMSKNPNLYCVSIEHEGSYGDLTEAQFEASVWLHFYIRNYVRSLCKFSIPLDKEHVIGHFQIDPRRKPNCPGKLFPWAELYSRLREEDKMKDEIELLKMQLTELRREHDELKQLIRGKQTEPATWARDGHNYVMQYGISDGSRPDGMVTRQEVWTMLKRSRDVK
jgi:N-acetylmuramoyl-L-alanine amidase